MGTVLRIISMHEERQEVTRSLDHHLFVPLKCFSSLTLPKFTTLDELLFSLLLSALDNFQG